MKTNNKKYYTDSSNTNVKDINSGLRFIQDVYEQYYNSGFITKLLTDHEKIKNAIFMNRNQNDTSKYAMYYKRINYANQDDILINKMLVPGEYGGRQLRSNLAVLDADNNIIAGGDRAHILYKIAGKAKRSLETGDIIITYIVDKSKRVNQFFI